MATTTIEHSCPAEDAATRARHRRRARARAAKCSTCSRGGSPMFPSATCIGCKELISYYSCAPGYCMLCAHDPCWMPVE